MDLMGLDMDTLPISKHMGIIGCLDRHRTQMNFLTANACTNF